MIRKRTIGLFTAVAFAVGSMVGGGVFALSGLALQKAGPAVIVAFLASAAIMLFSALSLAILARRADGDESAYDVIGSELSPLMAFVVQWSFYLNAVIVVAFVLNAFGTYMTNFIVHGTNSLLWAAIALATLVALNFASARIIGRVESWLVIVKISVLALLIVGGLTHLSSHDFMPFTPQGFNGVMDASAMLFIAFLGFNVVTNISSEIDRPRRTIPLAIIISMAIVTVVYIGVVLALLAAHLTRYDETSVGLAATQLIGPLGGLLVIIGALIATLSAANANLLGSSDIMLRLSADRQLPSRFGWSWRGHPVVSVVIAGVVAAILLVTHAISLAINLANITAIIGLIVINLAAFRILTRRRNMMIPLLVLVPLVGTAGALWQFAAMPAQQIALGFGLVLLGVVIYSMREHYFERGLHRLAELAVRHGETPLLHAMRGKDQ